METSENFLQNCLYWHTEISIYRCRINQIRKQLQQLKPKLVSGTTYKKYTSVVQDVHEALTMLKNTESCVMGVIRKNINFPASPTAGQLNSHIDSEDDLFLAMKNCYNLFIHLQQSFNYLLNEITMLKTKSKVVEFPASRRRQKGVEKIGEQQVYLSQTLLEVHSN
jgi:hypothetical protein